MGINNVSSVFIMFLDQDDVMDEIVLKYYNDFVLLIPVFWFLFM